ncbi:unnamed protein product [Aureobasidium mustum]|uniref:Uncharacterized protein n=1 Tax=Aureobasidium mustum TaxID=2773714 RepID=A0A9N8PG19_9PEZI|nr:unnamed protein product [Aureobasidium mustum]
MASHPSTNQDLINERPGTSAGDSSPVSAGSPASTNMGPEYHSPEMHPPHSHPSIKHDHTNSGRRLTDEFEQSLRARAAATGKQDDIDAIGIAIGSDHGGSDVPPALYPGRKQSFKIDDKKRAAMEHIFNSEPKAGYTTSTPKN